MDDCAVCLDHIPNAGWFLEIEGQSRKIREIALRLGLKRADREHRSYRKQIREAADLRPASAHNAKACLRA